MVEKDNDKKDIETIKKKVEMGNSEVKVKKEDNKDKVESKGTKASKKSSKKEGNKNKVVEGKDVEGKKKKEVKSDDKKAQKPKRKSRKRSSSKKANPSVVARGKRKLSIARASVKKGRGNVRINKLAVSGINNKYVREIVMEPVKLAGEKALEVDIYVNVNGGGVLGQAQASRTAIAKALIKYFDDGSLKEIYMERDKSILVEDPRRVESKKFKGPKARARSQKSYR